MVDNITVKRTVVLPNRATVQEILKDAGPFANEEGELCRVCRAAPAARHSCNHYSPPLSLQKMVQELTVEEQQSAARTSYAYWAWEHLEEDKESVDEMRFSRAMHEARRHLVGQGNDYDKALTFFKKTVEWRIVRGIAESFVSM